MAGLGWAELESGLIGDTIFSFILARDSSLSWNHFLNCRVLEGDLSLQVETLERHLVKLLEHLSCKDGDEVSVFNLDKLELVLLLLLCHHYNSIGFIVINTVFITIDPCT